MTLDEASWPIERAGEALAALAGRAGLAVGRELPAPGAAVLADPDDAAMDRWLAGAAATLGLEAEAIDSDLGGVDALLRRSAPALLRVGVGGRRLLLVLRGGRRWLTVLTPALRAWRVALARVRGEVCEPALASSRADAEALIGRTGLTGARRERAVELLLHQRGAARRVGRAWLLRASPAAPLWALLRADGLLPQLAGLIGLRALELGLVIGSWWLIAGLVFAGRSDPGWAAAWMLMLLTIVPCRMGQTALVGEVLRGAGTILKRRLLVGAMAMDGDLTRREGAGLLLGRVLETSAVEALGLRGGLLALFAGLEFMAAIPVLARGPAGWLHVPMLVVWALLAVALVRRTGLHLRAWTDERAALTHHLVEVMVGHRTRLAQQPPAHWHEREDVRLRGVLAAEERLNGSEALLVALVPRGWLVLGVVGLVPAFLAEGPGSAVALATGIGGVFLAQRGLTTLVGGATQLLAAGVALREALPMLRASAGVDAGARGSMLALPPVPAGQPLLVARGLGFRYPGRERRVLAGVDLTIVAGERLLLAGGSGGGKSTLGAIVAGLREPGEGLVLLAGLDRPTLGLVGWRRRVAAAPQFHENHVFTATFAFNLLMGRGWPPGAADLAEAQAVCEELGLGELLARMPGGLMQMVGETGWQLSHGERSRLYIARALLQKVDLLVLDESFAALDPRTLQQALACVLARARAVLVIAHP